ncbi:thioredoxin domain-containing protein [Mariniblastus fucicola]|uniref:Spermatogenesis-associated protein 20-like TRX domain-containing protein n=1 Tax=Mariniblastus fucicola TaxID=980251 RepID=A0A5B9PEI9_9BACT|nr:thioredoxin domain-containing protein [Mariniblastus fucicola]QEG21373.1 hypothetical protein MFFC18_12290 [Mariniblastus fucicola]
MPNRLENESSPYLLQHANNPVDWYPWGEEALARSRDEDKPIFLSIGYSACHWCHVMEHESFEDNAIAKLLNENYIAIKVDREERPDLDMIYMDAVMALKNGQGGWPLSVFLTPTQQVFYGGTYWPPQARMGMPGFGQVLMSVLDAYVNKRQQIETQSAEITQWLNQANDSGAELDRQQVVINGVRAMENQYDFTNGGFGTQPKFPHAMDLRWLNQIADAWPLQESPSRQVVQTMIDLNLQKMALGGIYDHLGGGFARYSVDEKWLVPHFEKMLYDNALLTMAYTERCQRDADPFCQSVVEETIEYVLETLTDPAGGFYSTEDADSEGEEGKFYVWSPQEIESVIGEEAAEFCADYDVFPSGNFEGKSILNLTDRLAKATSQEMFDLKMKWSGARAKLLEARSQRIRPGLDDKVIVSWNGLMISAMARAASVFENEKWKSAAIAAAEFVLGSVRRDDGRLRHTWRNGTATIDGYLDDYAAMLCGTLELYRLTFDSRWVAEAKHLADSMIQHFSDPAGGFFFTADDAEKLIARRKPWHDNSVPGGNSLAACGLLELGRLTGDSSYVQMAHDTIEASAHVLNRVPHAAAQMLIALTLSSQPQREIVIAGDAEKARLQMQQLAKKWIPGVSLILATDKDDAESGPLASVMEGKEIDWDSVTLFDCEGFSCKLPVIGEDQVSAWIDALDEVAG